MNTNLYSHFHLSSSTFNEITFVKVNQIKLQKKRLKKQRFAIKLPSQYLQRLAGGCPQSVLTGMISWGHNLHRVHAPSPINRDYAFNTMLSIKIISFYVNVTNKNIQNDRIFNNEFRNTIIFPLILVAITNINL